MSKFRDVKTLQKFASAHASMSYGQKWCLAFSSSGDQIDVCHLDTVFELYSAHHLGQVVEAPYPGGVIYTKFMPTSAIVVFQWLTENVDP
jgi:hypothetical protein